MPLGKISSRQIEEAFEVLSQLDRLVGYNNSNATTTKLITEMCNQFYTLIPHHFGTKTPTRLDCKDLIKVQCSIYKTK